MVIYYVDFAESYRNDLQSEIKSPYFESQSFSHFTSCCYFKGETSVVVVTKHSDHNRIK